MEAVDLENCNDEQHCVRTVGPGLQQLVLFDDEVFAEDGGPVAGNKKSGAVVVSGATAVRSKEMVSMYRLWPWADRNAIRETGHAEYTSTYFPKPDMGRLKAIDQGSNGLNMLKLFSPKFTSGSGFFHGRRAVLRAGGGAVLCLDSSKDGKPLC